MIINEEGYIARDDGTVIMDGEEPISAKSVKGFKSQDDLNQLAGKMRGEITDYKDMIAKLEEKGVNAEDYKRRLAKAELDLERTHEKAKAEAEAELIGAHRRQLEKLSGQYQQQEARANQAEAKYRETRIGNAILREAGQQRFRDPQDALLRLRDRAKIEPRLDDDGKPTGGDDLLFRIEVTKDEKTVEEWVEAKAATEWLATEYPHYIESTPGSGPPLRGRQTGGPEPGVDSM